MTNGIEWISELPEYSFVRIESTAIEKQDWTRVLRDLDANFLMSLALGHECHFYDCGTRRETSKTVSVGIPYIIAQLSYVWFTHDEWLALTAEMRAVKRKLMYFKRYVNTAHIKLTGHSRATNNDGNKAYYKGIVHELELAPHAAE